MINFAGYYDLPLNEYLADPCPEPSLSKSTILTLTNRTPRRARAEHPRFGNRRSETTSRGEIGSAVHATATHGATIVYAPAEFEDWRKKAAQEFREQARADGALALLERQHSIVETAGSNARGTLQSFGPGEAEKTLIFKWEGVWFRTRPDWLTDAHDCELKTCEDADPDEWVRRTVEPSGYDIQMALRHLGHLVMGHPREVWWVLQEIENDLETVRVRVSAELIEVGMRKIRHAAKLWRQCLDSEQWPGHPQDLIALPSSTALWNLEARGIA